MIDRALEGNIYPLEGQILENLNKALVFAPHPDDEVFGCGGTLCLLARNEAKIKVIVLSNGNLSPNTNSDDIIEERRQESIEAARVLGYPEPVFWDIQDRSIRYREELIKRVIDVIEEFSPGITFAPSLTEMHPDHQATSLIVTEALRRAKHKSILAFYEVSAALMPSALVDISSVDDIKVKAMECFKSQEKQALYSERILSLNRYRAINFGIPVSSAEAFYWVEPEKINCRLDYCIPHPLNRRRLLKLANDPEDIPLVSVIIRSMDRETLQEAIESVVLQTYPNIEILIVDVTGGRHRKIPDEISGLTVRMISSHEPLNRSRAANHGLSAARGKYLIFLDDDDLFFSQHIQKLVTTVVAQSAHFVAYSGVSVVDFNNEELLSYDHPWSLSHLLCANFLPINSVLFHRNLVEAGCCFDEDLSVLEDWDFWLQLAQHSSFIHVPGVSAIYRYSLGESHTADTSHPHYYKRWRKLIISKWSGILGHNAIEEALNWCVPQYDYFLQLSESFKREAEHLKKDNLVLSDEMKRIPHLKAENRELQLQVDRMRDELNSILQSHSWRITSPLRKIALFLRQIRVS